MHAHAHRRRKAALSPYTMYYNRLRTTRNAWISTEGELLGENSRQQWTAGTAGQEKNFGRELRRNKYG